MSIGWIKLHRSIQDHWIYQKPEYFHAWVTILLTVNHEDKQVLINNELFECKRGQSLRSLPSWADTLGKNWTVMKVRTFFKLLESDEMIQIQGLRKTTRLSVCNYDTYQSRQQTDNTQITHKQQTDNTQITSNKNDKNIKNEENEKEKTYACIDLKLWKAYKEMRNKQGKPLTVYASNLIMEDLVKFEKHYKGCANDCIKKAVLNQWISIYAPSKEDLTNNQPHNPF